LKSLQTEHEFFFGRRNSKHLRSSSFYFIKWLMTKKFYELIENDARR
jgi:hypothetical protein